jgi:hypothetical protein
MQKKDKRGDPAAGLDDARLLDGRELGDEPLCDREVHSAVLRCALTVAMQQRTIPNDGSRLVGCHRHLAVTSPMMTRARKYVPAC